MQKATSDFLDSVITARGVHQLYNAARQASALAKDELDRPVAGALMLFHWALIAMAHDLETDLTPEKWQLRAQQIESITSFVRTGNRAALVALASLS